MITIPIWAALAAPFVCFLLGVVAMACFAMAGYDGDEARSGEE